MVTRRIAMVLTAGVGSETTPTALRLLERLQHHGHRLVVFAHGDAGALTVVGGPFADLIATLIGRGVHGGAMHWVVDAAAQRRFGGPAVQIPGVVPGGPADLWTCVREADVVLAPGTGAAWPGG